MEFLLFISIIVFAVILWACLKVASDADDIEETIREKIKIKKGKK